MGKTRTWRFFEAVTAYPKTILAVVAIITIATASFLPRLTKDTSADAFMPAGHPAVVFRDKVKGTFGLKDPLVVAVVNNGPQGVFNPESLKLIKWLTDRITELPGIDADRVTSLASEKNIIGVPEGLQVEPFFTDPPQTQEESDAVRDAVAAFPLYNGNLIGQDGKATLIAAELLDEEQSQEAYRQLRALVETAPRSNGEEIHVAGQGGVMGYLGQYVDTDAQRLSPLAAVIVVFILFLCYRNLRGVLLPLLVVGATLAVAMGAMAAAGKPIYTITNALPVVLIGIAVADSIHILGQYYDELMLRPKASARELAVRTMMAMWRPVTITSLTTIAGFMGIYVSSAMPPMEDFGLFATLGIATAMILSLVAVPAGLTLVKPRMSPALRAARQASDALGAAQSEASSQSRGELFGRQIGRAVAHNPKTVLAIGLLVIGAGLLGLTQLRADEAPIDNFQTDEPIAVADRVINDLMNGTTTLDVVIETQEAEALFDPERLRRIEALQRFIEGLPSVKSTVSIADYLKQMNQALFDNQADAYELPETADQVAQYFLLYSMSGDPTDFEEEVDYDYRLANVRVTMNSGLYSAETEVIAALEDYLAAEFNSADMTARLSGHVTVHYNWMNQLLSGHLTSVLISLLAVWVMSSLTFRSIIAGSLTLMPVAISVFLVYALMGAAGIRLAIGTSMSAAIAIGIGVDFAVHSLDRLILLAGDRARSLDEAIEDLFPTTGRALLFNFLTVFFGFGVLISSQVPGLIRFGSLVAVAVSASFIASMTVLPALVKLLPPAFLTEQFRIAQASREISVRWERLGISGTPDRA
ncbi:RND family transporter [Pelagibius sp. Alg239-R121]|uniref:efflux RND transporter permease subunit n=1 Tax=Pelagibius sp. Alg239-R121 TaxID=2993448 RepID=UPI0024A6AA8C|nr:MMPL family transporter [Pelagibius sp. Alg239-R121]